MRESGFCSQHHGPNANHGPAEPPAELMCVAEYMVPRIILRLIQHLRINSVPSNAQMDPEEQLSKCEQVRVFIYFSTNTIMPSMYKFIICLPSGDQDG